MPVCICGICGKSFTEVPSRIQDGRGKWCSQSCYWESKRKSPDDAWQLVDQSDGPKSCWPWLGTITNLGYGQFKSNGVLWRAHRLIYTIVNGDIPPEMVVRHMCDNRRCCNPSHLEIGTHEDNMRDAKERNRMASGDRSFARRHPEMMRRGGKHPNAKLNESVVLDILQSRSQGESVQSLSQRTGVCKTSVRNVISGKTWGHVTLRQGESAKQG